MSIYELIMRILKIKIKEEKHVYKLILINKKLTSISD